MSNVLLTTYYDNCTLKYLIESNDLEGVRYKILEKKVNVNSEDGRPGAPIHFAAQVGNPKILRLLIEAGADVNIRDRWDADTALFYAKDGTTAKILVEAGAEVNVINLLFYQPLHSAVRKNKLSVVEFLVNRAGVNVNAITRLGMSPLEIACRYGLCLNVGSELSFKIIKLLIKNGADVNRLNKEIILKTPLMQLLRHRQPLEPEIIKIFRLVLRQSDISINDFGDVSANVSFFNLKLCEIFLEHVAVLLSLGTTLSSHEDLIKNYQKADLRVYFEKCKNELVEAKSRKIGDSWVTLHHLLTDRKRKLKNYAGNENLVESLRDIDLINEFPIYGKQILEKMNKGVRIRKLYDESCGLLSSNVPIFGPNHLIIRDLFDCCLIYSTKYLEKFCSK